MQNYITMDFENIYKNTPEPLKLKYLDAIVKHNDRLQQEFIAFVGDYANATEKPGYDAFAAIIKEVQSIYQNHFEAVDLENPDWDNYTPSHSGYIEEWEQYQQASEQEFQEYFQMFISEALDKIIIQRPDELLAMILGLYEAALASDVTDELGSFEDVNKFLLEEHSSALMAITEKLRLSALSGSKTGAAFELFFRYCKERYSGKPDLVSHIEPILIALAEKSGDAAQLLTMMEKAGIEQKILPELTLLLFKSSGNKDGWLHAALQLYRNSEAVARELLQYYYENDQSAFVKTAHELFPFGENSWANFLEPYVTPQLDEQLYVKVLLTLIHSSHNIKHYRKVKPYLDEASYNEMIQKLKWNKVFLVSIFAEDERHADIKALVEKETDYYNFAELIAPILTIYPDFCLRKMKDMVEKALASSRGRSIYERIAKWLILAKTIPGHETDAMQLINKTYTHKPNLPALKDEMRKAGVV